MLPEKEVLDPRDYPSGSQFYAMSNCDIAFSLSHAAGEEPQTAFSEHGTLVHAVLSGTAVSDDKDVLEEARMLESMRKADLEAWLDPDQPFREFSEKRLWIQIAPQVYFSGQPDKYVIQGRRAFLSDYKTGWHTLDDWVATNSQIRTYVALIDQSVRRPRLESITAAIHKQGAQSPPAFFDRQAIDDATDWAITVATEAQEPIGKKKPTRGPWCQYCSGKVLCPLWQKEVNSLANLSTAIVADIPDGVLRDMAPNLALAKTVAEKLLARLEERVKERPDFFRDWSFAKGPSRRKIPDTIAAYHSLVTRSQTLSTADFLAACRIAITELQKQTEAAQRIKPYQAKTLLEQSLGPLIEHSEPKPQLVYDPKPLPISTPVTGRQPETD